MPAFADDCDVFREIAQGFLHSQAQEILAGQGTSGVARGMRTFSRKER
jgi:hypothetical protein